MSEPANWYEAFVAGVGAAVASAWPDLSPGNLYTDVQSMKRDWTNLLDSGQMSPPWAVCKINIRGASGWGTGAPRYRATVTVYRIDADGTATGDVPIVGLVMGKMIDLQGEVLASPALGTVLMPDAEDGPNVNTDVPVEFGFLESDQRFTAGSLTFNSIIVAVTA